MKIFILLFAVCSWSSMVWSKGALSMNRWFTNQEHISLKITKSTGGGKPEITVPEIKDLEIIRGFINDFSALPLNDLEKMKQFSDDVEVWTLTFCNKEKKCDGIEFYDGRVKTPNTGFYTEPLDKSLSEKVKKLIYKGR